MSLMVLSCICTRIGDGICCAMLKKELEYLLVLRNMSVGQCNICRRTWSTFFSQHIDIGFMRHKDFCYFQIAPICCFMYWSKRGTR